MAFDYWPQHFRALKGINYSERECVWIRLVVKRSFHTFQCALQAIVRPMKSPRKSQRTSSDHVQLFCTCSRAQARTTPSASSLGLSLSLCARYLFLCRLRARLPFIQKIAHGRSRLKDSSHERVSPGGPGKRCSALLLHPRVHISPGPSVALRPHILCREEEYRNRAHKDSCACKVQRTVQAPSQEMCADQGGYDAEDTTPEAGQPRCCTSNWRWEYFGCPSI